MLYRLHTGGGYTGYKLGADGACSISTTFIPVGMDKISCK